MGRYDTGSDAPGTTADGRTPEYRWDGADRPSRAVVEAVAAATGREPATLSPLQRRVDTDALDSFLTSTREPGDERLSVSFAYEGVEVTVGTGGRIDVREPEAGSGRQAGEPTTDGELNAMIGELLRAASRNGLSVEGGWPARNGSAYPDWDVIVTRVEKRADADAHERS